MPPSSYLSLLQKSTKVFLPQYAPIMQSIPASNLLINYPLSLSQDSSFLSIYRYGNIFLESLQPIRKNNKIMLMQTNQIFSSINFAGATTKQEEDLNMKLRQLKEKYEIFDQDMIDRIKVTIALLSNNIDTAMYLHQNAKYILKYRKYNTIDTYIKTYSNSAFLKLFSTPIKQVYRSYYYYIGITTAYEYLHKSFLKQVKLQDFSGSYETVRYFSKQTNKIRTIFPYCNNIKHSFSPNCQLKAIFLSHRRMTFLTLQSIRDIQQNEYLTINYGDQNNYELLIKYGFVAENNKFSEFYLPLDYSQIQQVFNVNVDWKMNLFKKNKEMKFKNVVRINSEGYINKADFNMLKIIFSTQSATKQQFYDEKSNQNISLKQQIYHYVKSTGSRFKAMTQKVNNTKVKLTRNH